MDKRICGQAEKGKHQWSKNRLWREMEVGTEQWEVEHIFRASNVRTPKKSFLPAKRLELTVASLTLDCELVDERGTGPCYCNAPG